MQLGSTDPRLTTFSDAPPPARKGGGGRPYAPPPIFQMGTASGKKDLCCAGGADGFCRTEKETGGGAHFPHIMRGAAGRRARCPPPMAAVEEGNAGPTSTLRSVLFSLQMEKDREREVRKGGGVAAGVSGYFYAACGSEFAKKKYFPRNCPSPLPPPAHFCAGVQKSANGRKRRRNFGNRSPFPPLAGRARKKGPRRGFPLPPYPGRGVGEGVGDPKTHVENCLPSSPPRSVWRSFQSAHPCSDRSVNAKCAAGAASALEPPWAASR